MEGIPSAAKSIITLLWDPLTRRVNYFAKIEKNVDNLRNQVEGLRNLTADLKREAERAQLEGKVPKNIVLGWLRKADELIEKAEKMEEEFRSNERCCLGWCLDCLARYKLGERVVEATEKVNVHTKEKSFDEIAVDPLRGRVGELATETIREGTSAMGTLLQVWNWLTTAEAGKLGIWGKGGVGKTTVVKNINNKLLGTTHFDVVIFVTVSKDCSIEKLRNDIGKEMDSSAKQDETKQDETRVSLLNRLKGKRFLLILDDMWKKVDLDELGVPAAEKNSGRKIVITTRYRGLCNDMETDEEIEVKVLSDKEAWELFQEKAGNVISSELEPIARDVCNECRGLPLAITMVGRALRKETSREVWENALRVLKISGFELKGMEREVYLPLKYNYDRLESNNLRDCFLYCSLFPEDDEINVDDLIQYWTMEGFIEGVENLREASAKGHYLLKELIDSCLLERVRHDAVRMHDIIRDVAIKITSESTERGRKFLVRVGVELKGLEVEKWEGKDRISLIESRIPSLPDEPRCTELFTLLLQKNRSLKQIPLSFFKQMKNLRVLDLSYTDVVSLPPSISELGSLRALILRWCKLLKSVIHVGGLEHLQLLDLMGTRIVELPGEIGQLTRLRRLNLSRTSNLIYIPADIIVSVSLLEDLEMYESSYFISRNDECEALIGNLGHLNHLSLFSASIPNDLCTSSQWKFLHKLESFNLRIDALSDCRDSFLKRGSFGMVWMSMMQNFFLPARKPARRGRHLDITGDANVCQEAVGLLQYAEISSIHDQKEVRTISAMGARNLNRLKECWVRSCGKMENVVITEEAEGGIFLGLEILVLCDLQNLRSIWVGNGIQGSFRSIKVIALYLCPNVMHLFSSNVLQLLNSLEELYISSCYQMVEIVTGEVGNGVIALPRLRRILLEKLPKLNRMWEGVLSLESLQAIGVTWCHSLRQLAIDNEKTPALVAIKGERAWWDSLEWQNDSTKSHFQNKFATMSEGELLKRREELFWYEEDMWLFRI